MKKILLIVVSAWFWFSLFFISAVLFPVALLIFITTVLFDKKRKVIHYFSCLWADLVVWLNPLWKMRVEGRENMHRNIPYVMVANHSSGADILVLFRLFRPFKWVAKRSLFSYPFIGWNMWLNDYIPIERSRGRSKLQMMDKAADAIRSGNSVLIFPEGTRTPDGEIKTFKTGSFRLALETGTPILPIAISGTYRAIQKGGLIIHKSRNIRAKILKPLSFEEFKDMEAREIAVMVRERIVAETDQSLL